MRQLGWLGSPGVVLQGVGCEAAGKEKAFVLCHLVRSAGPPCAMSFPDQSCPPAFPQGGDLGRGQPHAAGGSGAGKCPAADLPPHLSGLRATPKGYTKGLASEAQPRVSIILSQEGSRTCPQKSRGGGLSGGHIHAPHSQKSLVLLLLTTTLWGSDLCQRHFPGRCDSGGLQDQVTGGIVSVGVTGLPRHHCPAAQRSADPADEAEQSKEAGGVSVSCIWVPRSPRQGG